MTANPTDNWEKALQKITDKENGNKWFQYSTKIAFALGRDADAKTLSQIVGNKEAVIQTSDLETFKKMIKVVSASSVLTNRWYLVHKDKIHQMLIL